MSVLRVGLTGGIASGKSSVAAAFADLGVPVYSADDIAHELTQPGTPLLAEIRATFGDVVFDDSGALDRRVLAQMVFEDESARRRLEALLHPPIRARLQRLAAGCEADYCILEIPLLDPADIGPLVDRVLVVDAPEDLRRGRLMARDNRSDAEAHAIVAAQSPAETLIQLADDIIDNGGEPEAIPGAVAVLDRLYRDIAAHGDPGRPGLRLP